MISTGSSPGRPAVRAGGEGAEACLGSTMMMLKMGETGGSYMQVGPTEGEADAQGDG